MCHSDLLLFVFLENSLLEKVSFHFIQKLFKLFFFFFFFSMEKHCLFCLQVSKLSFRKKKSFRISAGSEFVRIFLSILSRKNRPPHPRFRLLDGQVL